MDGNFAVLSDAGAVNTFERLLPADLSVLDSMRGQLRTFPCSPAALVGLRLRAGADSDPVSQISRPIDRFRANECRLPAAPCSIFRTDIDLSGCRNVSR
jgi:hypothetical protein